LIGIQQPTHTSQAPAVLLPSIKSSSSSSSSSSRGLGPLSLLLLPLLLLLLALAFLALALVSRCVSEGGACVQNGQQVMDAHTRIHSSADTPPHHPKRTGATARRRRRQPRRRSKGQQGSCLRCWPWSIWAGRAWPRPTSCWRSRWRTPARSWGRRWCVFLFLICSWPLLCAFWCVSLSICSWLLLCVMCFIYSLKPERPWLGPCAIYQTYVRACFTCLRGVDAESRCVLVCVSIQHNKHTLLPPHHTTPHHTPPQAPLLGSTRAKAGAAAAAAAAAGGGPCSCPYPPAATAPCTALCLSAGLVAAWLGTGGHWALRDALGE